MPYIINRTNGLKITVVADGTINTTSLDITLVGKNYTGYGEAFNENFVKLLENFSNNKQPVKPLSGQLWYDSTNKHISVYNGTKFRPLGVTISSNIRPSPSDSNKGDLWWDEGSGKLFAFNGTNYIPIGPANNKIGNTGAIASTVINSDNTLDTPVIKETVNSTIAFISYAGPHFNVDSTDDVYTGSGITFIQPGITMPGSDATHGVSVTNVLTKSGHMLWGTAATALGLVQSTNASTPGYHSADEFLLTSELNALPSKITIQDNDGILIGNPPVFQLHVTQAGGNRIANASVIDGKIFNVNVNTTAGGTYTNVVNFDGTSGLKMLPNATTPVNIGSTGLPFESLYARNIFAERITATDYIYDVEEMTAGTLTVSGTASANLFSGSGASLTNIPNGALVNNSVTVIAGSGMSGGGNVALGGTITLTNAGVKSLTAGADLAVSSTTGNITIANISTLETVTTRGASSSKVIQLTNATDSSSASTGALRVTGGAGIGGNLYVGGTVYSADRQLAFQDSVTWAITGTANQVLVNGGTAATVGNLTLTLPQSIATDSAVTFGSLGLSGAASVNSVNVGSPTSAASAGQIRATGDIFSFAASDRQFKENIREIPDALSKAIAIGGKLFDWTDAYISASGGEDDYFLRKQDFGVIAQDVQAVLPEAVRVKPDASLAVDYPKLCALAFAAIKQLNDELQELKRSK